MTQKAGVRSQGLLAKLHDWIAGQPIHRKLWLFTGISGFVAGTVASALLIVLALENERRELMVEAERVASIVAENALPALEFRDAETAREILIGLARDPEIISARVLDGEGQEFARFDAPHPNNWSLIQMDPIVVRVPMSTMDPTVGDFELTKNPSHSLTEQVGAVVFGVVSATLCALLLGSYLISRLNRTITDPLADLTRLMQEISSGNDYSRRAGVPSRDELGRLSESFNRMIQTIEERSVALGRELAERMRAERQLEHMAHHDQVTGLPNRHLLRKRLTDMSASRRGSDGAFALMFVDLDNFKNVNDTFGHDVGDQLLVAIADRLCSAVRAHDFVARFGGDEFVLLLDRLTESQAMVAIGEKILAAATAPLDIDGHRFVVTCSIGIACSRTTAANPELMLQRADAAMYVAKRNGKNNVQIWNEAISSEASERFALESDLRQALTRGELEMHYQPIVQLDSERIVGVEALMRWRHPVRGYVSPVEFIPVAEETGLILDLGAWAAETAFSQGAAWVEAYGPLFVAVNVSARQFRDPDFVSRIESIAVRSGLARELCELELTESMVMGDSEATLERLRDLAARGFRLSLDDFGTGYSSLAYLHQFPLYKLKIDRSFVQRIPGHPDGTSIAESILALARSLQLEVVAEGIETAEQAEALRTRACCCGQGFHFSRPMAAEQIARVLADEMSAGVLPVKETSLAG